VAVRLGAYSAHGAVLVCRRHAAGDWLVLVAGQGDAVAGQAPGGAPALRCPVRMAHVVQPRAGAWRVQAQGAGSQLGAHSRRRRRRSRASQTISPANPRAPLAVFTKMALDQMFMAPAGLGLFLAGAQAHTAARGQPCMLPGQAALARGGGGARVQPSRRPERALPRTQA